MKKLFTIREAAQYTGLSPSTLYSWVWQKKIPYVKLGKAVRFDVADLDKFIELHRIGDLPQTRPLVYRLLRRYQTSPGKGRDAEGGCRKGACDSQC